MDEEKLSKLIEGFPQSPGVYLMKSSRGKIVYIGKAKNLRSRIRSYFSPSAADRRFFAQHIRDLVADIEIVLTATEKEALLLEHNLIRRHTPRFNIRLRDDKEYLSLRLDLENRWPRLELIRRPKKDKALYFGPYHNASAARQTQRSASRYFLLRTCKDRQMANRLRPCLQHQMHRCLAPCTLDVDPKEYRKQVEYARLFLLGRREQLLDELRRGMRAYAEDLDFERAAALRDSIQAIEAILTPQGISSFRSLDQDIIGFHREGSEVQIAVLEVRSGRLLGRLPFFFADQEFPDEEILSSFIVQHYTDAASIPSEIAVSRALPDAAALAELLSERRDAKVRVVNPQRGQRADQVAMADMNAKQLLEERLKDDTELQLRLARIQRRLRLPKPPHRIECVDISHLAGGDTVGAISAVVDGQISRKDGRTYHVRTATGGDDFAAISEVLSRRFTRAKNGDESWNPPDLLVVDGGRSHLASVRAVLAELGFESQPVVALAKERSAGENADTDRIYLPGRMNPIALKAGMSSLQLLAMSRDEAHRLAVGFQRKTRHKATLTSELDRIEGIGPKLRNELLKRLGSVKRIRQASLEELNAVPGVGKVLAAKIKEALDRSAS